MLLRSNIIEGILRMIFIVGHNVLNYILFIVEYNFHPYYYQFYFFQHFTTVALTID